MAVTEASPDQNEGNLFRPVGAVTIVRAGSISREIENLSDPLTIDLSGVERMDTVGASAPLKELQGKCGFIREGVVGIAKARLAASAAG